jgi:hypothetical protein
MAQWRLILTAFVTIAASPVLAAQARRVTPPQEVASLDDLRPKTPDQIARAEYFVLNDFWRQALKPQPLVEAKTFFFDPYIRQLVGDAPRTPAQALEHQVCRSSIVIVGQAVSSQAFLTKDGIALFTDFPVLVDRWIRPASGDREILVSMQGGRAIVGGSLKLDAFLHFFMETRQRYIMYLQWSDAARAYIHLRKPVPAAGGKVIHSEFPRLQLEDEEAYLKQLSSTAALCKPFLGSEVVS